MTCFDVFPIVPMRWRTLLKLKQTDGELNALNRVFTGGNARQLFSQLFPDQRRRWCPHKAKFVSRAVTQVTQGRTVTHFPSRAHFTYTQRPLPYGVYREMCHLRHRVTGLSGSQYRIPRAPRFPRRHLSTVRTAAIRR